MGAEAALDDSWRDARLFYVSFGAITGVAPLVVLVPGALGRAGSAATIAVIVLVTVSVAVLLVLSV